MEQAGKSTREKGREEERERGRKRRGESDGGGGDDVENDVKVILMKAKVIQTSLKLQNLVVSSTIQSLKEIGSYDSNWSRCKPKLKVYFKQIT